MKTKISSRRGIIFVTPAEYTDEKEAQEMIDFIENKFLAKSVESYSIVVNLNGYRGHDPNVRSIFGKYLRDKKDRTAKIGIVSPKLDKLSEVALMTIFAIGGCPHFRFFDREEETIKWIREK